MRIASFCERTGSLPNPGGLLDQIETHVVKMDCVYRAQDRWVSEKSGTSPQQQAHERVKEKALLITEHGD